jgi:hypothetical protein
LRLWHSVKALKNLSKFSILIHRANIMPFLRSHKNHTNGQGSTVVVTTTTTTTTTSPANNYNFQPTGQKPSLLSKLKGNNANNTRVTRETHTTPASTASSGSLGMSRFGHKNKTTAPLTLNNGIGARSNNPVYTNNNGVRKKPGMGDRLRAKWATSGSSKTTGTPARRNY